MGLAPRAPRGYQQGDFPLQHELEWNFGLSADTTPTTGGNSTIMPLFFHDEAAEDPTAINVNPRHASFDISTQSNCVSNSIIPKVSFNFSATMSEDMIEVSKARAIRFSWWPLYSSFTDYLAEDDRTGTLTAGIAELVSSDATEELYPIWDTTDLLDASVAPAAQLTIGGGVWENVAIDKSLMFDAFKYYGNGAKLRSMIGPIHNVTVTRDRPYYYSSRNFTQPRVKRMNSYTFCGVAFYVPKEGTVDQVLELLTCTDSKTSIFFRGRTSFQEWNRSWLQDEN